MVQASVRDEAWYTRAFGRLYLRLYAHRNDAEAARQAPMLARWLRVRAGDSVLDVACGAGRHARALARLGLRVLGVDLSKELLEEARERSPGLPGSPQYVLADIRRLPPLGAFGGAISMFTSIGYFGRRGDDLAILQGVHRSLVPGGRFVLDFLNEQEVRANLEPLSVEEQAGLRIRSERRIEEDVQGSPTVVKRIRVESIGNRLIQTEHEERVRLYTADEIDALLEEAGLAPVEDRFGDYEGQPLAADSPRLIRIAERPARRR